VSQQADPTVIPLKDSAAEQVIAIPEMNLTVGPVAADAGARSAVTVTIRPNRRDNFARGANDPRRPDFAAFDQDRVLDRLELRDVNGRRLRFGSDGMTRGADGKGFYDRYRLVVPPAFDDPLDRGGGPASKPPIPVELRYYGFVQNATDVPFDLRDIPIP
jgi:hypothetical protein